MHHPQRSRSAGTSPHRLGSPTTGACWGSRQGRRAALLDIGAGVGTLHLALLEAGAATAMDVDASKEYPAAARAEADRRGLAERVAYRYGDVVELAAELPPSTS
ncbi:MAG: methyltransferase domain-containing protein [Candidatus Limnocylindria bacterium]